MKRVFEAQRDGAMLELHSDIILAPTIKKGDTLILNDNAIEGWKMLSTNEELKKKKCKECGRRF